MSREMRESGISWIGSVPKSWKVVPHKYVMRKEKHICDRYEGQDILSLTMRGVIVRDLINPSGKMPATFDGYQRVRSGNLLLCLFDIDVTPRCVGLINNDGLTSPAYSQFALKNNYSAKYYYYLLRMIDDKKSFLHLSKNLRNSLTETDFGQILTIVPPIIEQRRISEYLDQKCLEIDNIIDETRKSIEEYKEYKISLVNEVVTTGVNPDVSLKDSHVEWLGKIPEHWGTIKLKYLFRIKKEIANELGHDILSVTQSGIKIRDISNNEGQISADYSKYQLVQAGDFIMNHMDLLTGWVDCSPYRGVTSPDYRVFKLINEDSNYKKYYTYLLQTCYKNKTFYGLAQGVSHLGRWRLQTDKFMNFTLPILSIKEQQDIANFLDEKCYEIDKIINQKQRLIIELESYKKNLIYECTTGKIDIPEIEMHNEPIAVYPLFPVVLPTNKKRFAQAILASKVIETAHSSQFGRVKLEKMLYTLESHIGFDFETEYKREIAGPLDGSIYQCENMISQRNKWFSITKNKYGVKYSPTKEMSKYKTYYKKYYAEYDSEINRVINIFKPLSTDEAEILATLYASWNDFIITGNTFNDEDIVNDVMNNWHDSKKRFSKETWFNAIEQMKKQDLVPKGYGKKTVSG